MHQEIIHIDLEGAGQSIKKIDARVEGSAFNAADRAAIAPGIDCKVLLRHGARDTQAA